MKKSFPGFYHPSDKELDAAWQSNETIFVFDTNTFLNLYGYADQTINDFFSILERISDKIWVPYHVILEYQRRRLSVVSDEKAIFQTINTNLEKIISVFESNFSNLKLDRRFPALNEKTEELHTDIKELISNYKKTVAHWDKKQPCVRGHDKIRTKLDSIFEDKIGNATLA